MKYSQTNSNMKNILFSFVLILFVSLGFGQTVPREMVVLEIGTGTWCQFCPGAAMGADDLLENGKLVSVVENHNGDGFANVYSNARNSYYSISSFPTAKFDGILSVVGGSASQSMYPSYLPKYNQRKAKPSDVSMVMEVTNVDLNYTATITLTKAPDWAATTPVLQFAVTQSNILYNWYGQTHLEHVNRLMVPSATGTVVDFSGGDTQVIILNFTLNSQWPVEDVEFVSWVQDNTGKEVHQSIKRAAIDLSVDFTASATQINKGEDVTFTSVVSGGYIGVPQTYEWFTPGGVPVYSQEANVTVTYNNCGPHDVTLVVNRGGQIDTVARTHYIQVGPVVTVTSSPGDSTCWYTPITLDATTATAVSYLWSPGGETTPSILVTAGTYGVGAHTFNATVTTSDGCVQTIPHEIFFDACTGIGEPAKGLSASVYPNPNSGRFTLVIDGKGTTDLRIVNLIGTTVYEESGLNINGKVTRSMNLNLSSGLYFLVLQNTEGKSIHKFSVTR
jgi:PKD repeat protein